MNGLILTRCSQDVGFIKNVFKLVDCDAKIALDLCEIERYGRNFVLEFLLVDDEFFDYGPDTKFLRLCLGILNGHIPIIYFSKNSPEIALSIDLNSEIKELKNEVQEVFAKAILQIEKFNNISKNMLRPAERKLYSLLKENNQKSFSLEEMSLCLWGTANIAHVKTLYAYIHRIKKILEENADDLESLEKEKKGFYRLKPKPIQKDCQYCDFFKDWVL